MFQQQAAIFYQIPQCLSGCKQRASSLFVIPAASCWFIVKASLKIVYPEMSLRNTDNSGFIRRGHTQYVLCAVRMYHKLGL